MKDRKNYILKYAIEMLIVAFGVMLGIYVSEWKSVRKLKENASQSLSNIIIELETNSENLESCITYHTEIKENLMSFTEPLKEQELLEPYFENKHLHFTKIKDWKGVNLPKFESIAFESAKMNGVLQHIDIEQVQLIAAAYEQIDFNKEFGQSLFDKMINMSSSTKVIDALGMIELLSYDILNCEKKLRSDLTKICEDLKAQSRKKSK